MVPATDTTSPSGTTPMRDHRTTPRGVVPRSLQMWLMIGLAVIILVIILFTGHSAPPPKTAAPRTTEPALMPSDRIQAYQRQLAEDEARLQRELAQAPGPARGNAASSVTDTRLAAADPIADERRRREYQSLFADNVALSRRPADAPSYAERTPAARTGSVAPTPPVDVALLHTLLSQPANAASASVSTPVTPSAPERVAAGTQAEAAETSMRPKGTGPIESSDPLQRLTEGTVIETVLINRLDGSLTGPVACLVTTPVYAHDRQRVLIPAGARVLGAAAPVQTWGESRLAVSFHRLVMPDGRTVSLDRFTGLDQIGETGLKDDVNRHYLQVFGASIAIGALSGLAQYGTSAGYGPSSFGDQYRQAAGASLAASTGRVLDRYLNVLPTITIREGYRIKVYLTNDLDLPPYAATSLGGVP
jgi:type IV secretory pathway VirB10-like protein